MSIMKMAALSRESGFTVASIKFYLREGLLPAGERTGVNQAEYGEAHLRRLSLIRVFRDVAHLPIEAIRTIVLALESGEHPHLVAGKVIDALSDAFGPGEPAEGSPEGLNAERETAKLLEQLGWRIEPHSSARRDLVRAVAHVRESFIRGFDAGALLPYAIGLGEMARQESAYTAGGFADSPEHGLEAVALGTVLMEPLVLAIRRAAHEHWSAVRLGIEPAPNVGAAATET